MKKKQPCGGVCAWLENVKKLDELIEAKLAERAQAWAMATDITSKDSDGMPFAKGNISDQVGNGAVKLRMLEQEIDALVDKYVDYKKEVISALEKLPATEYGVLHRHYVRYMTLEQIGSDMGYCRSQVWRIKKKALKKLEDAVECNIEV